jgi:hypothetical protein
VRILTCKEPPEPTFSRHPRPISPKYCPKGAEPAPSRRSPQVTRRTSAAVFGRRRLVTCSIAAELCTSLFYFATIVFVRKRLSRAFLICPAKVFVRFSFGPSHIWGQSCFLPDPSQEALICSFAHTHSGNAHPKRFALQATPRSPGERCTLPFVLAARCCTPLPPAALLTAAPAVVRRCHCRLRGPLSERHLSAAKAALSPALAVS